MALQMQNGFNGFHLDACAGEFKATRSDAWHQPIDQRAQPSRGTSQRQAAGSTLCVGQKTAHGRAALTGAADGLQAQMRVDAMKAADTEKKE